VPAQRQPPSGRFVAFCGAESAIGEPVARVYGTAMTTFLSSFLLPIALISVTVVLLLGLLNMMRGGSPNRSQKLMQMRVLLQFVAIVIAMAAVWALGR
jgi:ABC-type Na+ efflux pump permease subunit